MSGKCFCPLADHPLGEYIYENQGPGRGWTVCRECREKIRDLKRHEFYHHARGHCIICGKEIEYLATNCGAAHRKTLSRIRHEMPRKAEREF